MADPALVIALYAALVSTFVAIRDTVMGLRHRARRLEVRLSHYPVGAFSVDITNVGTAANTPTGFILTIGRWRIERFICLGAEPKLPVRLEPGESVSQVCRDANLRDKILRHPTMDLYVEDAFGKRWYLRRGTRRLLRRDGRARRSAQKEKA